MILTGFGLMSNINGDRVWFYRSHFGIYALLLWGEAGREGCFFCECENDHHGCPKNENHIREWLFRLIQAILDHYFLWKNIENWKSYIDCPDTVRWVTVPLFFLLKMGREIMGKWPSWLSQTCKPHQGVTFSSTSGEWIPPIRMKKYWNLKTLRPFVCCCWPVIWLQNTWKAWF